MEYLSNCCKVKVLVTDRHANSAICRKCNKECEVIGVKFSNGDESIDYRESEKYMVANKPNHFEL